MSDVLDPVLPMAPLAESPHPSPLPAIPGEGTRGHRFTSAYVIETAWLAAGFGSKLLIQMATLYYLTANLGRDGTGTFFALMAMLACLVPFVQLGHYDLTIRQIAQSEDPRAVAGRAMRGTLAAFLAMLPVLIALKWLLAGEVSWTAFLAVAAGELLLSRLMTNVQAVATGFRLHYVAALCDFVMGLCRLAAVAIASHLHWGVNGVLIAYAFTAVPAAVGSYAWLALRHGHPRWHGRLMSDWADHRRLLVACFADMAAGQGDKPLLKALSTAGDVGIYGLACKLFVASTVPVDLLTQVLRPRVSAAYGRGVADGERYERKMTVGLVGLGAIIGVCLLAGAWALPKFLPRLAGSQFDDARVALMFLSVVAPLYGLQRANVIAAISRGATGVCATAMSVAAVAGLGTLTATGGHFGWRGGCLGYGVYIGTSCVVMWHLSRRQLAARPPVSAPADLALVAV